MDSLQALHHALRDAAADGFAAADAPDLGPRLRELTQGVRALELDASWSEQLSRFAGGLDRFEERGRQDRSRVIAHGLRICMGLRALQSEAESPTRAKPSLGRERKTTKKKATKRAAASASHGRRARASAPATSSLREEPLSVLPGVGAKTATKLGERGLHTVADLAFLLPLAYEDRRSRMTLAEAQEGQSGVVEGTIKSFRQGWMRGRYMATLHLEQEDEGGKVELLEARWFHPVGGLNQRVTTGESITLAGTIKLFRGKKSMVHPDVLEPGREGEAILVRYPLIEGIGARTVAKLCRAATTRFVAAYEQLGEFLPEALVQEQQLLSLGDALNRLHYPDEDIEAEALVELQERRSGAHRRLAFDEFFMLQLALLRRRVAWREAPASLVVSAQGLDREALRVCLPFEPTAAQWRVLGEVESDLGGSRPMLRLLQGDVGSGKTVIAFAGAMAVVAAGGQAALMAPTEILAEQHLRTLGPWCEKAGIRLACLTGSTPRAQRSSLLALLAAGEIDLLIGTHALLVEGVDFSRLGLVVIDEQHRFGVEQRALLRDKGSAPHLLVMTATPIPRSLALTAFGELDVSVLDELPPGRVPVRTALFAGRRALEKARRRLCEQVEAGTKAFVVCPLVEASDAVDASDVEATAQALRERLPGRSIAVVHGRMTGAEKDAVMEAFRAGDTEVVVATTVIEVGVDVPDARVILVEHAERFGLAQLHQLRGRVGRGGGQSHCFLHTGGAKDSDSAERLAVMEATNDGFEVAERDLQLRGPGEMFGKRQSGVPRLRFASFTASGLKTLIAAREAAKSLLARDPSLREFPRLREVLDERLADAELYAGESG